MILGLVMALILFALVVVEELILVALVGALILVGEFIARDEKVEQGDRNNDKRREA